jgi:molybdate transport repressor ModE-like protein
MRFDFVDLRLFLFVAESGSITLGAERAGLALASASARIKGMEESLGAPLFERRRQGISLTPAGRALVHHAQAVQSQVERMTGELGQYAKGLRAHVRLLSNTAAAAEFLPEILAGFLSKHAHIDVDLEERPSHAIVEAIASGAADMGIAIARSDFDHLEHRPFRTDRLVLLTAREWPRFRRNQSIAFNEVATEPFVGLSPGNPLQEHIVRQAARLGHHLVFRVRLATLDAVCRLVFRGIGIAGVPEVAARRPGRASRLHIVPLKDEWATRQLVLWARRFSGLSPHAKLLAEALAADDASSSVGKKHVLDLGRRE